MLRLLVLVALTTVAACSPPNPAVSDATRFNADLGPGICYETNGCQSERTNWLDISQSRCQAYGGRSWRSDQTGCVNF